MIHYDMDNIFMITLKHKIYEACIDTFFSKMNTNFGNGTSAPVIGKRYSRVVDVGNGETFYNCIIIPLSELSYYNELMDEIEEDEEDISDYLFGLKFQTYVDTDTGDRESFAADDLGDTHFTVDDIEFIKFYE